MQRNIIQPGNYFVKRYLGFHHFKGILNHLAHANSRRMRINDCYVLAATLPGCQPGSVYSAAHAGSKVDAYNAVFFRNFIKYT